MRTQQRAVTAVAAIALAGLALAGCSSSGASTVAGVAEVEYTGESYDGPDVTLTLWNPFTGADGPFFEALVEEFNDEHDNITIETTSMDSTEMYSKIPTAVRSGRGPDIAISHLQSVPTLAAQGALTGLTNIAESLDLQESDFAPAVWNAGELDGTRYAIPLDVHPLGLFYNKDLFAQAGLDPEAPPTTGVELIAALDALKEAGIQGLWQATNDERTFRTLLAQYGGTEFSEDGTTAAFNSEAGIKALEWMTMLVDEGYSPANVDDAWKAFISGTNAMGFFGVWSLGEKSLDNFQWGVAEVPIIGDQQGVWAASHQFVLTQQVLDDDNKAAAAAYAINRLSENSVAWAAANQVPARASVRGSADVQAMTTLAPFIAELDALAINPTLPGLENALSPIEQAINKALVTDTTPEEALEEAEKLANDILVDNQAKYGY